MTNVHPSKQPSTQPTAADIISLLGLEPHPEEGGYFIRNYYSEERIVKSALPERYEGERRYGSAIYYLITPDSCSSLHRLTTDEIFHFYLGDPVEMLQLHPDGTGELVLIGTELFQGMRPQVIVPRGVWQGSRLVSGGRYGFALLGTTMAPAFEYQDYTHGNPTELIKQYPQFREQIIALTS